MKHGRRIHLEYTGMHGRRHHLDYLKALKASIWSSTGMKARKASSSGVVLKARKASSSGLLG